MLHRFTMQQMQHTSQHEACKMSKYNFSRKHWMVIILCFLLNTVNTACTTDGENILLPRIAAANSWEYTTVLNIATVVGTLSVLGQLFFGKVCEKKGPRFTMVLCLLLTSGFMLIYGSSHYYWMFAVGLFGTISCSTSFSFIGGNALIANWCPQKKGLALGFTSMGSPTSTIIMVSLLTALITFVGLTKGITVISVCLTVLAVICFFTVVDRPEMCGETPDNLPRSENCGADSLNSGSQVPHMKTSELLKTKNFWLLVIVLGIVSLATTGLMAQFIVRYTSSCFKEATAILMMSITAMVGIPGSFLVGNTINRFGTKKAYAFYAFIYATALLLNCTNIPVLIYITIPIFGLVITVIHNFLTAFQVGVFGRDSFGTSNAIIFPLVNMIGHLSFVTISICMSIWGEVRFAYPVLAVLLLISLIFSHFITMDFEEVK